MARETPLAILLDVDGTLYHQAPVRLGVMSRLVVGHARAPLSGLRTVFMLWSYRRAQERLRHTGVPEGHGLDATQLELSSRSARTTPVDMERVVARWMGEVPQPLLPRARRRGLHAFLDEARARNIKLGVVSDYPAETKLSSLGVRHYFDVVVCAQDADVQRFKPDPRGIVRALERLEVAAHRAVYVGDRADVDLPAAERAGVRGILMRPSFRARPPGLDHVADYRALHAHLFR